jgi:hypothetical protein
MMFTGIPRMGRNCKFSVLWRQRSLMDTSIEQTVTPPLLWHLEKYEFNPLTKVLLTDSDLKAYWGEEKYKEMITNQIEKKRRWGLPLSRDDEQFLRECPEGEAAVSAPKA